MVQGGLGVPLISPHSSNVIGIFSVEILGVSSISGIEQPFFALHHHLKSNNKNKKNNPPKGFLIFMVNHLDIVHGQKKVKIHMLMGISCK